MLLATALSFMAQTPAPQSAADSAVEKEGAAKLINFTGQISVIRGGDPWALSTGSIVKRQEVIVTGSDGWGVFEVADGSKFEVFPKSRVVFRADQGEWRQLLDVWLGKVRVQIEHFGGLPNNNKVHTPTAVISVRGTIFSVEVEDQTHTTTVIDEEGSVSVRHRLHTGEEKILNPGEYVKVFENQPLARALIDKNGILQHLNQALSDALRQVALGSHNGTGGIKVPAGGGTQPADQNKGGAAPPPPPTPPPPPH
jgi:ferric-dicitrate binding protein FerR (iron transport regulator)